MWDDTNINLQLKPSSADAQHTTYSAYYGDNVCKGGVFLQLRGWLGVEYLWVGATSDSHYQEHIGIFKEQEQFAMCDLVDGVLLPFMSIFDKGYGVNLMSWRHGTQEVKQPVFARSDRKFRGVETLMSASIATDRSGNERAVKISKLSGLLQRGLTCTGCPKRLDDIWLVWSFQTNFMYKPVLQQVIAIYYSR